MDWTATLLDAAGTGPGEGYPLDGASLLPWLIDGADYPEHDLFWCIASQGALRHGNSKYLRDGRDRAIIGSWGESDSTDSDLATLRQGRGPGERLSDTQPLGGKVALGNERGVRRVSSLRGDEAELLG